MHEGTGEARWLDAEEIAAVAGVSRTTVYKWLARGRLAPRPTADGPRVDRDELDRFLLLRRAAAVAGKRVRTLARWREGDA